MRRSQHLYIICLLIVFLVWILKNIAVHTNAIYDMKIEMRFIVQSDREKPFPGIGLRYQRNWCDARVSSGQMENETRMPLASYFASQRFSPKHHVTVNTIQTTNKQTNNYTNGPWWEYSIHSTISIRNHSNQQFIGLGFQPGGWLRLNWSHLNSGGRFACWFRKDGASPPGILGFPKVSRFSGFVNYAFHYESNRQKWEGHRRTKAGGARRTKVDG